MTPDEFFAIYTDIEISKVSEFRFVPAEPNTEYKKIHSKGDIKHDWFFWKIYYKNDIIKSRYSGKEYSMDKFELLRQTSIMYIKNADKYPVWFIPGIEVVFNKSRYRNEPHIVSKICYVGGIMSEEEIRCLVEQLNNRLNHEND